MSASTLDAVVTVGNTACMTTNENFDSECKHGIDEQFCSICRSAAGYRPGSDKFNNDCSVRTFVELTGAEYSEAVEIMSEHGYRPGKGVKSSVLRAALHSVGFDTIEVTHDIDLHSLPSTSDTYYVTAFVGKRGHAYTISNGDVNRGGKYFSGARIKYRAFRVA